jgi:hypothetical protein
MRLQAAFLTGSSLAMRSWRSWCRKEATARIASKLCLMPDRSCAPLPERPIPRRPPCRKAEAEGCRRQRQFDAATVLCLIQIKVPSSSARKYEFGLLCLVHPPTLIEIIRTTKERVPLRDTLMTNAGRQLDVGSLVPIQKGRSRAPESPRHRLPPAPRHQARGLESSTYKGLRYPL